nr:polyketide synthase dehydratase domain-containing protein [uncultured Desulfobulbus sp.]
MTATQTEHRLSIFPWMSDHCFGGRTVLAAVEAMQLLANCVQAADPQMEVRTMDAARFAKLLVIPPSANAMEVVVELETSEKQGIRARLLSRTQGKVMTRLVSHCELGFLPQAPCHPEKALWRETANAPATMSVPASRIYQELVPFGPSYRTLQDRLYISGDRAWGSLLAFDPGDSSAKPLGAPFPLDGAMHAACVHGQGLVDFVPFPVGFAARQIVTPTRAGELYQTQVQLQRLAADELIYDLVICDQKGGIREWVQALRMRDVSQGRIRPPAWIKGQKR